MLVVFVGLVVVAFSMALALYSMIKKSDATYDKSLILFLVGVLIMIAAVIGTYILRIM